MRPFHRPELALVAPLHYGNIGYGIRACMTTRSGSTTAALNGASEPAGLLR
jgi:hypothetical protein